MSEMNFDPLGQLAEDVASDAVRQRVRNVIRSYHHGTDILAESVQNAVDELTLAYINVEAGETRAQAQPRLEVVIDTSSSTLTIADNGRGIPFEAIKRLLAPDVTLKAEDFRRGRVRGHKGVGLTFLAYGFNAFELESRTDGGDHYLVRLRDARSWVESGGPRPHAVVSQDASELQLTSSGTRLRLTVGGITTPANLAGALPSAQFASYVLESMTAVGVLNPEGHALPPLKGDLRYVTKAGETETLPLSFAYRYPHSSLPPDLRILDLGAWRRANPALTEPDAKDRAAYHAVHETYDSVALQDLVVDPVGDMSADEAKAWITEHKLYVYVLRSWSATYRDRLAQAWDVRGTRRMHEAGVRIGSDGMPSSWAREIALAHRGFDVERLWLMYHFRGVEPDLGRKDFPPEVLAVVNYTQERLANLHGKHAAPFLRVAPKQRAGGSTPSGALPAVRAHEARTSRHSYRIPGIRPFDVSIPREEQEVVALFSFLRGLGILNSYDPVFFSSGEYDSYFDYLPSPTFPDAAASTHPGDPAVAGRELQGVAEFKLRASDLVPDLANSTKDFFEMNWLVAWDVDQVTAKAGQETLTFQAVEPNERRYTGVTHLARLNSAGNKVVHVISLKALLEGLANA